MACRADLIRGKTLWKTVLSLGFALTVTGGSVCRAQMPPSIADMAENEMTARLHPVRYEYVSEERSERTGMHLWRERVVELGNNQVRRLIAVDGRPLTPQETAAETRRLQSVVAHEDDYWRESRAHKDDEKHLGSLLELLPKAFIVTPDGTEGECKRYRFVPNPAYQPAGLEERVGAAMEGTVSVHEPDDRLCALEARLQHKVTFGYGLIGRIDSGGNFRMERTLVYGTEWKSDKIVVHLGGKVLMMKSFAKDQETMRSHVRSIPQNLTLAQAVELVQR
jgi:hypothetical protein